jgi:hypothetical protein
MDLMLVDERSNAQSLGQFITVNDEISKLLEISIDVKLSQFSKEIDFRSEQHEARNEIRFGKFETTGILKVDEIKSREDTSLSVFHPAKSVE